MSTYKRGGTYWYSFVFEGQRVQASTKVGNAKDARDIERAARTDLARGAVGLPTKGAAAKKDATIGELLDGLQTVYGQPLSPQRVSVLKQARHFFGAKIAVKLTHEDVEKFIGARRAEGKRPATINRTLEVIRRAYRAAKLTAPEIKHLSEAGNAREGFFEPADFARLAEHLPKNLRDFVHFAFLTGWRRNEIETLTWRDIEGDVVRLRPANAKNGEARSVVLTGELANIMERRKQARLAGGTLSNLVFHRDGAPVQEFRKSWASACVAARLGAMACVKCQSQGVTRRCAKCKAATVYVGRIFHDLRRSGVRNMVRAGVPQSVAMKISGHKTASMFRRYDIASEGDLRQAMESVERYNREQASKVVAMSAAQ